ncbi:MAG: DNA translocase FtsK 4TM domain-containing protein, partial [Paracoccaceae bacterium]
MASYQARQRDPLLDQNTQAMLEKRGRELLGLGLILIALIFAAILGSYSPDDPGWMVATEEPAKNMLGRFGAAISSTLIILIGRGSWTIPLILFAWGVRFVLHRGGERALARIVFAVIAVALAATYAATLTKPVSWPHTFGLGGLFGETVAGALIGIIPGSDGFGLRALSASTFFALVAMVFYVTGFDRAELRAIYRWLLNGSILTYSALMQLMGKGASGALSGAARGARGLQDRAAAARIAKAESRQGDWQPPVMASAAP